MQPMILNSKLHYKNVWMAPKRKINDSNLSEKMF